MSEWHAVSCGQVSEARAHLLGKSCALSTKGNLYKMFQPLIISERGMQCVTAEEISFHIHTHHRHEIAILREIVVWSLR